MFARADQPPIFAPEGVSWEFPSRADRGCGPVPDEPRLGGAAAGGHPVPLAPLARHAAGAVRGVMQEAAALAREFFLLADPELEAQADDLARADDGSGSCVASCAPRLRAPQPPHRARRPGRPVPSAEAHPCLVARPRT